MRRFALILLLAGLMAPASFAHAPDGPIAPRDLWHHWSFDPIVWVSLLVAHLLYVYGLLHAWTRTGAGRIVPLWRLASFMAGELVLVIALISPLDPLGETLLAAHMVQHILLSAVAPPLLVLGLPVRAWTWALPRTWRRLGASPPVRFVVGVMNTLSRPPIATLIATLVLWLWHAPALFEAALEVEWIHTLEHVSFFLSSLLLWRAAFSHRTSSVAAAGIVLVTFMTGGMLGGLMLLAPVPLYDWYGDSAVLWGLSALQDQQLAGLAMWVPAGGVYLAAFAVFALRAADLSPRSSGSRRGPSKGIIRASTSSRSIK
jgi:putative membrane protein